MLIKKIKPLSGLCITFLVSAPWYIAELIVEGKPFWDSFFGYHNFQRMTMVVNSHSQPWWFFIMMLLIASFPFSPFLVLGLTKYLTCLVKVDKTKMNRSVDKNIDELLSRLESTSISGKKKISQARSSRRSIKRGRR